MKEKKSFQFKELKKCKNNLFIKFQVFNIRRHHLSVWKILFIPPDEMSELGHGPKHRKSILKNCLFFKVGYGENKSADSAIA